MRQKRDVLKRVKVFKKIRKVFYEKGNHLGNEGKRIILRKKNENENV